MSLCKIHEVRLFFGLQHVLNCLLLTVVCPYLKIKVCVIHPRTIAFLREMTHYGEFMFKGVTVLANRESVTVI